MRSMRAGSCFAALAAALGCTSTSTQLESDSALAVEAPPVTYAGTLPCASCPGIEWTLTLLEDGTHRLRRIYLETGGTARTQIDLGHWDTGGLNDRVVLRGSSDAPIHLQRQSADVLHLLGPDGQPMQSRRGRELERQPELDRIADMFPMEGEYAYVADAGRFAECRTRRSLPVAREGDNVALERAYLESAAEPGAPVLVRFEGRFAMRPPMEGDGLREMVIVETFDAAERGQRCEGAVDPAPLTGTFWRLTELPGDGTFMVDPGLRAHLMLADGRVSGSSGCNRVIGTFTASGNALTFAQLAGTRMACAPAAMELERRFHAALGSTESYAIDGEILVLHGADGPVARFERYLE